MRVLVIGAAGMLGRKLTERLAQDGALGPDPISGLVLADVVPGEPIADGGFDLEEVTADVGDARVAEGLVAQRPDVIFDLAAVVSGEAEADFDKGYRVNLDVTR